MTRSATPYAALWLCALVSIGMSSCSRDLPPYGQARVTVDTDLPVRPFAVRLRVDVYTTDGQWIDSRDLSMSSPSQWPASFTVFTRANEGTREALVRFRAYPDGAIRDYRGERFTPTPTGAAPTSHVPVPDPTDAPRLVKDGIDVTPASEPEPSTSIDRLLLVSIAANQESAPAVMLRGECSGIMADITGFETCTDADHPSVSVREVAADALGPRSAEGTFAAETPCTSTPREGRQAPDGTPLHDDEVCVPGGAFILGSDVPTHVGTNGAEISLAAKPMRFSKVDAMLVDRYEVTVGRFRQAIREGFRPAEGSPVSNDGAFVLPSTDGVSTATYSSEPMGREELPLNMVSWQTAHDFCAFYGGRLLTEAEWEYVASASGRPYKTAYPWGDDPPTCDRAVYARGEKDSITNEVTQISLCSSTGEALGPVPVTANIGDATPTYGIRHLAGNVSEWLEDSAQPYDSVCWSLSHVDRRGCANADPRVRAVRGGSWALPLYLLPLSTRLGCPTRAAAFDIGFRCMRPGGTTP